jgi:hypothetical protein
LVTGKGIVVMPVTAGSGGMQSHGHHKDVAESLKNTMVLAARPWTANKIPHHRPEREALFMKNDFFDLTNLIRSVQRAEGNPDCFARAQGHCDRLDCAWLQYCLEKPQDETPAYQNEQSAVHENETNARNQLPR